MAKAPIDINWADILPSVGDDAPPPELVVVGRGEGEEEEPVATLSDHQIRDQSQRILRLLETGMATKLPDNGEKLRLRLRRLQEELDRRKLVHLRKDAGESERSRESESAELGDPVCNKELRSTSQLECEILRKNKQQIHAGKQSNRGACQPTTLSSRSSPFQCASSLANNDKKRRHISENRHALDAKSKKVQHVVLLDEDEVQPKQLTLGDASEDWVELKIYYPSRDDPESVELSNLDKKCLDPESYLSSPIMNFYIRYLQRPLSPIGRPIGEYYFFNTYFYRKLEEAVSCKDGRVARFSKLRRWWKGVNIFQKAYIFLPIHGASHWSLVIICIPPKEDESGPIVLHLDSLGIHASNLILDIVECCLKEEWNCVNQNSPPPDVPILERVWSDLPHRIVKKRIMVPQQKNAYDCGLFVLYFMERFIEEAPARLKTKDLDMFGSKWFQPEDASGLRKRIRDLLDEEFENARLENGRPESPTSSSSSLENDG